MDCVVPGNRCYSANNEGHKQRQDCRLQALTAHLHIFFSDEIMFEFDLPRQVELGPPGVCLEESICLVDISPHIKTKRRCWKQTFSLLNLAYTALDWRLISVLSGISVLI